MKTIILKFGGASVKSPECFSKIADIILTKVTEYPRVIVVISAMANMTDYLIDLAKQVNSEPPRREYDMLVSVGERISISLLAMALAKKNKEAVSFTGSQSGIITCSNHSEARIINVKPHRLLNALSEGKVIIVAGFQGVSEKGEITTLGRGGSDTTAVALGVALNAEKVEFFKDVEGIFAENPKINHNAKFYTSLDFKEAIDVVEKTGGKILHPRSIKLAQKNHLPLQILSFQTYPERGGTLIFDSEERLQTPIYE